MQPGISTHVLLQQRLETRHLDAFATAGARHIELFAARHHFDYTDRSAVREIGSWFRDHGVLAALHQPLYTEQRWSRHVEPTLNLIHRDKSHRIAAMDEVKRALEFAEAAPLSYAVLHLGLTHDPWTESALEHSLTAIEHLKAFASPLGIRLLLENLHNLVTTPARLLEILRVGHFDSLGVCFNAAHAHLAPNDRPADATDGILPALDTLRPRIAAVHLSDNDTRTDEHLWPATPTQGGTIPWPTILPALNTLPPATPQIQEITHTTREDLPTVCRRFSEAVDLVSRSEERTAIN